MVDRATTVGTTWLGLTLGLPECHDHKFDAISQREFYQLYAFFNNVDEVNFDAPLPGRARALGASQARIRSQAGASCSPRWRRRWPSSRPIGSSGCSRPRRIPGVDFTWDRALEVLGLDLGPKPMAKGNWKGSTSSRRRPPSGRRSSAIGCWITFWPIRRRFTTPNSPNCKVGELRAKLDAAEERRCRRSAVRRCVMQTLNPRPTHVHVRGDFRRHGDEVTPGTPAALARLCDRPGSGPAGLGPLAGLARASADGPRHGESFVAGAVRPRHRGHERELWRAWRARLRIPSCSIGWRSNFAIARWSIKEMLRLIVLSQTYRQSSAAGRNWRCAIRSNALFARQARWRLSAEAVRDNALAVSGLLCRTVGGPSVKPPQPASVSKEGFQKRLGGEHGSGSLSSRPVHVHPADFALCAVRHLRFARHQPLSARRRERSNTPLQALRPAERSGVHRSGPGAGRRGLRAKPAIATRAG